jgi:hypothetical protein
MAYKTPAELLVKRLRQLADCDARAGEPLGKCMREAADEIESLVADRDMWMDLFCDTQTTPARPRSLFRRAGRRHDTR